MVAVRARTTPLIAHPPLRSAKFSPSPRSPDVRMFFAPVAESRIAQVSNEPSARLRSRHRPSLKQRRFSRGRSDTGDSGYHGRARVLHWKDDFPGARRQGAVLQRTGDVARLGRSPSTGDIETRPGRDRLPAAAARTLLRCAHRYGPGWPACVHSGQDAGPRTAGRRLRLRLAEVRRKAGVLRTGRTAQADVHQGRHRTGRGARTRRSVRDLRHPRADGRGEHQDQTSLPHAQPLRETDHYRREHSAGRGQRGVHFDPDAAQQRHEVTSSQQPGAGAEEPDGGAARQVHVPGGAVRLQLLGAGSRVLLQEGKGLPPLSARCVARGARVRRDPWLFGWRATCSTSAGSTRPGCSKTIGVTSTTRRPNCRC